MQDLQPGLDAAKDAALRGVRSIMAAQVNAVGYWRRAKKDGDLAGAIQNLAVLFRTLSMLHQEITAALKPEVRDALISARARAGAATPIVIGSRRYATFHDAAADALDRLLGIPLFAAPPLAATVENLLLDGRDSPGSWAEWETLVARWPADVRREYLEAIVGEIRAFESGVLDAAGDIESEWAATESGCLRERANEAAPGIEPLTENQQEAYDLICAKGPLTGKQIVKELGLSSESTFTRHFVPALRKRGVVNRRGLGYYHPDAHRSPD